MSNNNRPFFHAWLGAKTNLNFDLWLEQLHMVLLGMRRPMEEGTIYSRYKDVGGTLEYQEFAALREVVQQIYGL